MSTGFVATASKFRYQGQRHTNDIKYRIEKLHEKSLAVMLEILVDPANWALVQSERGNPLNPNFTGETQATFRLLRDYLKSSSITVDLHDFTQPFVDQRKFKFPKLWNIPAKIANLGDADVVTAAGVKNIFVVRIQSSPFKITVIFESGAYMFQRESPLFPLWEVAKEAYKRDFAERLKTELFEFNDFGKEVKKYFNRVQIRSK